MKKIFLLLLFLCSNAFASLTDVKFGRYQIADSQWNVSACLYTTTCQIYSKQPGVAYKIPWTSGQVQWATGDYVKFELSGNASFPYTAKQYNSAGSLKATLGSGKIVNMGPDYFFFVGSDNNTGQLFSGSSGMANTSGVSWTGTLNPTIAQADAYANATYSTEPLAAGQTAAPAAPSLCCGGSSTAFSADPNNTAKVQAFINRTTQDSQVYIEQLGNQNTITVNQTGTKNNYTKYYSNGSSNTITITQSGNSNTQANYIDASVVGNSNNVNLQQQSTGGGKGIFATVNNNNNTLLIQQKDSGSHYADVSLFGGSKNVDILQQGSASHMAKVTLSGTTTDLSLSQSGSTQNFYSINFNCATVGGCAKITVTQGQ
jgi:hypothetical protein